MNLQMKGEIRRLSLAWHHNFLLIFLLTKVSSTSLQLFHDFFNFVIPSANRYIPIWEHLSNLVASRKPVLCILNNLNDTTSMIQLV